MDTIIQITAGRGPAECTWVAAQVLKKVLEEAQEKSLEATVVYRESGNENGTVETALVALNGKGADGFAASWKGTVQWIGQSQFRKMHKRKNWFIGIFEVEKPKQTTILEKDIEYQAMRSSGAGGQHVNKVSSAIRATHVPTGTSVVAMDSRSQHQNKKLAKERLLEKLEVVNLGLIKNEFQTQWRNQLQIERGNPTRVFKGTDFKKEKEVKKNKTERQRFKKELKDEIYR